MNAERALREAGKTARDDALIPRAAALARAAPPRRCAPRRARRTPASACPRRDAAQAIEVRAMLAQLGLVAALELRPARRLVAEPLAQLRCSARCPFIQSSSAAFCLLSRRAATGGRPVMRSAVGGLGRGVGAFAAGRATAGSSASAWAGSGASQRAPARRPTRAMPPLSRSRPWPSPSPGVEPARDAGARASWCLDAKPRQVRRPWGNAGDATRLTPTRPANRVFLGRLHRHGASA